MERQQKNPGNEVKVMRLPEASANYEELLQAIFEADSVAIW